MLSLFLTATNIWFFSLFWLSVHIIGEIGTEFVLYIHVHVYVCVLVDICWLFVSFDSPIIEDCIDNMEYFKNPQK